MGRLPPDQTRASAGRLYTRVWTVVLETGREASGVLVVVDLVWSLPA